MHERARGPMSATGVSVVQPPRTARSPVRDPLSAHLLTVGVVAILAFLLIRGSDALVQSLQTQWPALLFWTTLVFVVNLFPIAVGDTRLSLDDPTLLAVSFLYAPEAAVLVPILGSIDRRELTREVGFSRAVFNRTQIALSVYLAGQVFHMVAGGLEPWTLAVMGTAAALAVDYATNLTFVALFVGARRGEPFGTAARGLTVGDAREFFVAYVGYGALALVLARLFSDVGAWSVVAFLIPTAVARQMLLKGQRLQELAGRLQSRERLLERLVDRGVDERRDERLRIAGDLHDDVLQSLTHVWLLAKVLERKAAHEIDRSSDRQDLVASSEASIESLRAVIHDLKESPLGRGGLVPTMRLLVRDLKLDWKLPISLETPDRVALSPEAQVVAYQVAREAILNALKHAKASRIRVTIQQLSESVELSVEDDGVGFAREKIDSGTHFGVGLMDERVKRVQGTLMIQTQGQAGTRLAATFPLSLAPELG
jgi:signal transduction histidine kinase